MQTPESWREFAAAAWEASTQCRRGPRWPWVLSGWLSSVTSPANAPTRRTLIS